MISDIPVVESVRVFDEERHPIMGGYCICLGTLLR